MNTHTNTNTKTRAGSRNRKWFAVIALGVSALALAACTPTQALQAGDSGSVVPAPPQGGEGGDVQELPLPGRTLTCEEQAAVGVAEIGEDAGKFASARAEWFDTCRSNGGTVVVPDVVPEVPEAAPAPMPHSIGDADECTGTSTELPPQLSLDHAPTPEEIAKSEAWLNELCEGGTLTNAEYLRNFGPVGFLS